jgi:transcriptional regulator of nitric oxide reductase
MVPAMTTNPRQVAVRTIASSLAFDGATPAMRSLDRARAAGAQVVDALVAAGILPDTYADGDDAPVPVPVSANGAASPDDVPLFPDTDPA